MDIRMVGWMDIRYFTPTHQINPNNVYVRSVIIIRDSRTNTRKFLIRGLDILALELGTVFRLTFYLRLLSISLKKRLREHLIVHPQLRSLVYCIGYII